MKMTRQNFIKLMEKAELGVQVTRILTILLIISFSFNVVLTLDLTKSRAEINYSDKIISTMQNNDNEEISLTDVTDQLPTLPAIPTNLK